MTSRTHRVARGSSALAAATIAIGVGAVVPVAIGAIVGDESGGRAGPLFGLVFVLGAIGVSLLGRLIVRRADNVIGWAFQVMALAATAGLVTELIIQLAAARAPSGGSLGMALVGVPSPETGALETDAVATGLGVEIAGWINGLSLPTLALPVPLIFLLFPTGRPPSLRWRWLLGLWAASAGAALIWAAFRPANVYGSPPSDRLPSISIGNPVGLKGIDPVFDALGVGAAVGGSAAGLLAVISLVVRFRRARGEERAQMKWLALVGAGAATILGVMLLSDLILGDDALGESWLGTVLWVALVVLLLLGIPSAVAIGILKYRLYDVDVVINKAVVYSALAVFITGVYVSLVVGLGSVLGSRDEPNVALQIAATAIVAVAFQPVRARAQRLANRLVYGKRASPYEVLTGIARRAAGTFATEEVLPRMATIIAEGTGAARVDVWLRSGTELRPVASSPPDGARAAPVPLERDELPVLPGDRSVAVRHQGTLLGAIGLTLGRGERLTSSETDLLDDLASHAGLVLHNVALTDELRRRLEELEVQAAELAASRQRIVAAQDAERRRLERNIHDGAQQHLVALAVKVRLARSVADQDAAKVKRILVDLDAQVGDALETLVDLARGIYPPLLEEQGLAAALAARSLGAPVPVALDGGARRRYPMEVEAAAYFSILEALQNATKYANASGVRIALEEREDELRFSVTDDGSGFTLDGAGGGTGIQGMRDRVAALGGELSVVSAPGRGTTVTGRLPVMVPEGVR